MVPLTPFGMLSQDWNDPKALPKWHAVMAWCEIQTSNDEKLTGHWEFFKDAFISALDDMRTGGAYRKSRDELKKIMRQTAMEKARQGAKERIIRTALEKVIREHIELEVLRLAAKNAGEPDHESIRNSLNQELHIAEIDKQIVGILGSMRDIIHANTGDNE